MGGQLIVAITAAGGDAPGVAAGFLQQGLMGETVGEAFLRRRASSTGSCFSQNDAKGHLPVRQRNAPAPALVEAGDQHLTGRRGHAKILIVGKVRDVIPQTTLSADAKQAGEEPGASGGIDQKVRGLAPERGRKGVQRLPGGGVEREFCQGTGGVAHQPGPVRNKAGPKFGCAGFQQAVERQPVHIVGVSRQLRRNGREIEVDGRCQGMQEGNPGLVLADGGGAFLNPKTAQQGNHRWDETFPDQHFRAFPIIKNHHRNPSGRQQRGQGAGRRTSSENGDTSGHREMD